MNTKIPTHRPGWNRLNPRAFIHEGDVYPILTREGIAWIETCFDASDRMRVMDQECEDYHYFRRKPKGGKGGKGRKAK